MNCLGIRLDSSLAMLAMVCALLLSLDAIHTAGGVHGTQSVSCAGSVERTVVEADSSQVSGWPEEKLLQKLKQLIADGYLKPECTEDGSLLDVSTVPLHVGVPDATQLESWKKNRPDSGERLAELDLQLSGTTRGVDLGEGAPELASQRVTLPISSTTRLDSIYQQAGLDSLERDKVGYSLLDFVFIPRLEPVAPPDGQTGAAPTPERYQIYPVSVVASRVLDELVTLDGGSGESESEPAVELTLRAWKEELERAGVQLIQILQDNETVYFEDNYLETKDYTFQEVRAFDLVLYRQLESLVYVDQQGETPFSFWQVFDRFWEEFRKKAQTVRERDDSEERPPQN